MSTNFKKMLTMFAVVSAVSVVSQHRENFLLPTISASEREITQEAQIQPFIQNEINRRKNNTRVVPEVRRGEADRGQLQNMLREKREQRVIQISQKINELNAGATNRHLRTVERIESILQRVSERVSRAAQRGANITEVNTRMREAERLIREARQLIATQSKVVYKVSITNEETAAEAAKSVRENFRTNIKNVENAIQQARRSVTEVIKALGIAQDNINPSN